MAIYLLPTPIVIEEDTPFAVAVTLATPSLFAVNTPFETVPTDVSSTSQSISLVSAFTS